ncbi:MAG: glycolate oxidase subunit GlcF [Halioglobus sp.]
MHVNLHPELEQDEDAQRAAALTSACVHCGFCLETCPTYLDNRDERDSPRGRIYLIKQLLETGEAGSATRTHLDRCLTCRSCETTCPSGMQYGELLDIGRDMLEQTAPRSPGATALRALLRFAFTRQWLLQPSLRLAQALRPLMPRALRTRVPPRQAAGPLPQRQHTRSMLMLAGCVQQAATPRTNAAAQRVLDKLGIRLFAAPAAGCCGALNYHLAAHAAGLDDMRRNIDAWWPHIEQGVEAIVSSASGCGAMLADYARLLAHDPAYAHKAARVSALSRDLAEVLWAEDLSALGTPKGDNAIAVHTPCTLQHALQKPALLEDLMHRAGFTLTGTCDSHLCCGSAGTYSLLQPDAAARLAQRKLTALMIDSPQLIATANIGCQLHLQSHSNIPVKHWIELFDTH